MSIQGMVQSNRANLAMKNKSTYYELDRRKFENQARSGHLNTAIKRTLRNRFRKIKDKDGKEKEEKENNLYFGNCFYFCSEFVFGFYRLKLKDMLGGAGVMQGMIQSLRENKTLSKGKHFSDLDTRNFKGQERYGHLNKDILKAYTAEEKRVLKVRTKQKIQQKKTFQIVALLVVLIGSLMLFNIYLL